MNHWLLERKSAIAEGWLRQILETYPCEATAFLLNQKDRFANPIGSTFSNAIGPILDELFGEGDPEQVRSSIDEIIRIRAVQDFMSSDAASVFFLLKRVIRDEIEQQKDGRGRMGIEDILFLESKIDRFALAAFDAYMRCRERIWEIRFNDLTKRPFVASGAAMCPSYLIKKGMVKGVSSEDGNNHSLS